MYYCPRGPMDKASDYESGDCGFESHRGCSEVAQRKRVGLITQRSEDRNLPPLHSFSGFVAEWSKALDSSSSLHLKAWVRIPPEP